MENIRMQFDAWLDSLGNRIESPDHFCLPNWLNNLIPGTHRWSERELSRLLETVLKFTENFHKERRPTIFITCLTYHFFARDNTLAIVFSKLGQALGLSDDELGVVGFLIETIINVKIKKVFSREELQRLVDHPQSTELTILLGALAKTFPEAHPDFNFESDFEVACLEEGVPTA